MADTGPAPNWTGHSDTEALLAAIERGASAAPCSGDRHVRLRVLGRRRTLILARDRLGEKPLYYGRGRRGGPFLFASELKALAEHRGSRPRSIDNR